MIFQKPAHLSSEDAEEKETVVGPSVSVEGDFGSNSNIIIRGTVSGRVHTSKHLKVESGAKITASVEAGTATIAGEVHGNIKIKDILEITATAKILGDIEVKKLVIKEGALFCGKIIMPGLDKEVAKVS